MQKSIVKIFITVIFFLALQKNIAQSLVTASEDVTINIVKKITVNIAAENKFAKHIGRNKLKINSRNLLFSYFENPKTNQQFASNVKISVNSLTTTILEGKEKELRNLYKDDRLQVVVKKNKEIQNPKREHIFTIVY